jgi:Bacterial Ig domain
MRGLALLAFVLVTAIIAAPAAIAAQPSVAITSPSGGRVSGTVTLNASASTGTVRIDYYLDGAQVAYDATCCSWDEAWNTTNVAEGDHSLTAVARTAGGETGTSAPVKVTVDNVPDTVTGVIDPVATTDPVPPQPGGFACTGAPPDAPVKLYPWRTTFADAQAWWMPTRSAQTGQNLGHVHVGSCIPERESISEGTIPIDIRVILHNNPGTLMYVGVVVKGTKYEKTVAKLTTPNFTGVPGATVTRWLHYDLPLSSFDASGLQEIRYRVFVDEPNTSDVMHSSVNYQTFIWNNKTRSDVTRQPYLRFKGWYTGAGYCESAYRSDLTPLPDNVVSGAWSPALRLVWHGESSDRPVTHDAVRLDPDFHAMPPVEGTVLRDADGPWEGKQTVDTTMLANGIHRLHMKADCDDPRATNSGVGVIAFNVAN